MTRDLDPRKQQILDEIEQLEREFESRGATPRPIPTSVVSAYRVLLARHYDRLESVEPDRDPS